MTTKEALEAYKKQFPECREWVDILDGKNAQVDGWFSPAQLRFIADLVEAVAA